MRSFRTTAQVDAKGKLKLELSTHLRPGEHRVLVVVEEEDLANPDVAGWMMTKLPVIHGGTWPAGFSASRQELNDDPE